MKTIKFTTILLIAFACTQCKSLQFEQHPPFQITQAEYQHTVGGLPGVAGAKVTIHYTSKEEVVFESLYFLNKKVTLISKTENEKQILTANINTSSVNSKADLILHSDRTKEVGNAIPETKIPFELQENEAVISYQQNGNIKFFKLTNIKKSKTRFRS